MDVPCLNIKIHFAQNKCVKLEKKEVLEKILYYDTPIWDMSYKES